MEVESLTRANVVSGKNWPTINWGPSKTHASSKSSLKWSTMMMRNEGMRMILRAVLIVKEFQNSNSDDFN